MVAGVEAVDAVGLGELAIGGDGGLVGALEAILGEGLMELGDRVAFVAGRDEVASCVFD